MASDDQAIERIPVFDVRLEDEHVTAVVDTLRSGWLTMGPRIQAFEAQFAERRDISDIAVLASVLDGIGVDAQAALARSTTPEIKDRLRTQTEAASKRGIFGAPTFFVGDEMFWGNDRLHFVEAALR